MIKRRLITGPSLQKPTHTPTHSFNYYVEFNTHQRSQSKYAHSQVPQHEDDIIYTYILKLIICWLKL